MLRSGLKEAEKQLALYRDGKIGAVARCLEAAHRGEDNAESDAAYLIVADWLFTTRKGAQ